MAGDVGLGLQLTLVGMGMVFFALLVFASAMVLLVRLGRDRTAAREAQPEGAGHEVGPLGANPDPVQAAVAVAPDTERDLRERAAALAVVIALALDDQRQEAPQPFPLPPTALVSTWQAVMRANQMGRRRASR